MEKARMLGMEEAAAGGTEGGVARLEFRPPPPPRPRGARPLATES